MSYARVQSIREGAGLLLHSENETLSGNADGSNLAFTVARRPIVDGNYDDKVDADDVQVYVNGSSVEVGDVEATTGVVTLVVAPAVDDEVTADYYFSPITDEYVEGKQQEADSWIDGLLAGTRGITFPLTPVPGVVISAAELYAAGLILTRDWGSRVDSEQTSKDGRAKIKQARELLMDYLTGIKNQYIEDTNPQAVSVASDRDIFCRDSDDMNRYPYDDEDFFMRRQ